MEVEEEFEPAPEEMEEVGSPAPVERSLVISEIAKLPTVSLLFRWIPNQGAAGLCVDMKTEPFPAVPNNPMALALTASPTAY